MRTRLPENSSCVRKEQNQAPVEKAARPRPGRSSRRPRWKAVPPLGTVLRLAGMSLALAFGVHEHESLAAPLAAPRGLMQTKRGQVSYTRPPSAPAPAAIPQPLEVKDRLAVGEASWAILRFQDASE